MLDEIADNTTAVWDWAPPGTPVRSCLVIGSGSHPARNKYDCGKGPVAVHTPRRPGENLNRARSRARTRVHPP